MSNVITILLYRNWRKGYKWGKQRGCIKPFDDEEEDEKETTKSNSEEEINSVVPGILCSPILTDINNQPIRSYAIPKFKL